MINIKALLYGGIAAGFFGIMYYALSTWHYTPIKELETQVNSLQRQLDITATQLNTCESNLSAIGLQGYIDCKGENDEVIDPDLNNLHT